MFNNKHYLAITVAYVMVTMSGAVPNNTVCDSSNIHSPANVQQNVQKPNITNQFHTRVEIVIIDKNSTAYVHEFFDAINNRDYIEMRSEGIRLNIWYDYSTNELIVNYPDIPAGQACLVQDLSTSDERFLFGYSKINGVGHIFSASGALHFGGKGVNEVYMGTKKVRDITVDWWQSCQYWNDMDATMMVDWYFTASTSWDAAVGVQVPVGIQVAGVSNKNGVKHSFNHTYSFFEFRPFLNDDDNERFETPRGIQCPGRKLTKKLPPVAQDAFSFTTEILDTVSKKISFMKETFYYDQKLFMYEYTPQDSDYHPYGLNHLIEIHDFQSGVAYITDKSRRNCSYRAIEGSGLDDRSTGPNTVRIRNSQEFFYFDVVNVSYEGVKKNRFIECDTWVAVRTDFPFYSPMKSTWEWYFASNAWIEMKAGPYSGAIPVQLRISLPDINYNVEYNIYQFVKDKPDLTQFDISGCYTLAQRRKFQLMIPVDNVTMGVISTNVEKFKYYAIMSIVQLTGVKPIRVANLQVFFTDTIIVTFELLDVAPSVGDIKKDPNYKDVDLNFAASVLTQQIQNNQFFVELRGSEFINIIKQELYALPDSIIEITNITNITTTVLQDKQQVGFGPGPMAALGVTMPIIGAGMGIAFAYFFFR